MITEIQKQSAVHELNAYVNQMGSQAKAAKSLKGISEATVSLMINEKWDDIADEMWRKMMAQIDFNPNSWQVVPTRSIKKLQLLLKDAQENHNVYAITGKAGSGKTQAIKLYKRENRNVFALYCADYWHRKHFIKELLQKMGADYAGLTVAEMMAEAISRLSKADHPIIILDEADKLSDQVLQFFITLYNYLEDQCGIVLCSTDHLQKRIKRGLNLNKKGYNEIYSRMGRKFITLPEINQNDVYQVCMANGVESRTDLKNIWSDSDQDMRRVKRLIHAHNMKSQNQ